MSKKKYQASNANIAPPEVRVEGWATVVEQLVNISLLVALVAYMLMPAMLGEHVFKTLAIGAGLPAEGDVVLTLAQAKARGLFWFSALSISLASYAALYTILWASVASFGKPNLRYLVSSILCVSISSGDLVRMAAARTPLPEGAEVPVVYMSVWIDIPGIASSGFLQGLQYSVLAPFTLIGLAGVVLALYRIGKARLDRRLAARTSMKR
ncbi:hypothetical protein G6L37_05080 [Agrobacterium rubi]|nr:hypothetical protein [Agrobacterium rubi]NTF24729.1 hypothetical protein [Agrobacterium rubi]